MTRSRRRTQPIVRDTTGEEIVYNGCQVDWERMSLEGQAAFADLIRAAEARLRETYGKREGENDA